MLKSIIVFVLVIVSVVQLVECASFKKKNLYDDQYISLPHTKTSCGQLRKQFENGYIHLRDFLDRIRSCEESPGNKRHRHHHQHHHHHHYMTDNNNDNDDRHRKSDATYSYTDYLIPVVKDTSQDSSSENQITSKQKSSSQIVQPALPFTLSQDNTNPQSFEQQPMLSTFTQSLSPNDGFQNRQSEDNGNHQNFDEQISSSFAQSQSTSGLQDAQSQSTSGLQDRQNIISRKPKTVNGIVVDSAAGQMILRSMQNNNIVGNQRFSVPSNQQPTSTAFNPQTTTGDHSKNWSEYLQYRNILNNMGYDKNRHAVEKIDQELVRNQLSQQVSSFNNHNLPGIGTIKNHEAIPNLSLNNQILSPPLSHLRNQLISMSNQNPPLSTIENNQVLPQILPTGNHVLPKLVASRFFQMELPTNSIRSLSPGFEQASQISNFNSPTDEVSQLEANIASPTSARSFIQSPYSTDLPQSLRSPVQELQMINDDLHDDVSLLNENKARIHHLSLTDYESFAPQIIEKIAERSTINTANNKDQTSPGNTTILKRILSTDNSLNGKNSAKEILDIKYSQLEEKLLNDLKRRQGILQRLEQESMVQHFAKPGSIPLTKLGDVFQQINDETLHRASGIRKSIQNSALSQQQAIQLQDELGLFETNQKPTFKRNSAPIVNRISGLRFNSLPYYNGLNHLPQNFVLSKYADQIKHNTGFNMAYKIQKVGIHKPSQKNISQTTNDKSVLIHNRLTSNNTIAESSKSKKSQLDADSVNSDSNKKRAKLLLQKMKLADSRNSTASKDSDSNNNTASKNESNNKRTTIPSQSQTYSRKVLFSNKLFNDVIRAAMRRKNDIEISNHRNHAKTDNFKKIQKKSVIYRLRDRLRARQFNVNSVESGTENGNMG